MMEENEFENSFFEPIEQATVGNPEEPAADTPAEEPEVETESGDSEPESAETVSTETGSKVPLTALRKTRESNKELRSELDALKAQIAELKAPKPQAQTEAPASPVKPTLAPSNIPDPYDNPTEYTKYVQDQIAQQTSARVEEALWQNKVSDSISRAAATHGEAAVEEAGKWFDQQVALNPNLAVQARQQADPASWVIEQKSRHDQFAAFSADPDAYVLNRAAELGRTADTTSAQTTTAKKPNGPASLVNSKSANTDVDAKTAAEDLFTGLFGNK